MENTQQNKQAVQQQNDTALTEKRFYALVKYIDYPEDVLTLQNMEDSLQGDEMLKFAESFDEGDSIDQTDIYDQTPKSVFTNHENKDYLLSSYSNISYALYRKVSEQEIRDDIHRYGLDCNATDPVKAIANKMVSEEFSKNFGAPSFEMPSGDLLYFQFNEKSGQIEVGHVTNAGLHPQHKFDYDHDFTLDMNIMGVHEKLLEMEDYQEKESESRGLSR